MTFARALSIGLLLLAVVCALIFLGGCSAPAVFLTLCDVTPGAPECAGMP